MDLKTEPPLGVLEAKVQGEFGVALTLRSVHRLQEKVLEIE